MKKIVITYLFFLSITVNAQTDTTGTQNIQFSDSTAIGKADGKLTSKEIGINGGTVISDDGRIQLIFPAGSVTTTTTISIQPTTNMAPNGTGKSYQFKPSGTQFKKPVQFIFHYTDEEDETCPADLMAFAMQNHKGKWSFFNYETWDSAAKTLKGFIHHFSNASNIDEIKIRPDKKSLRVDKTTLIAVLDISKIAKEGTYKGDYDFALLLKEDVTTWYVNENEGGSPLVGTISNFAGPIGKEKVVIGDYKAPQFLPVNNPVTIALKIKYRSPQTKKWVTKKLTCSIGIYDVYKVKVTATIKEVLSVEIQDSATFIFWIFSDYNRMDDIKNYEPKVINQGSVLPGGCKMRVFTEGTEGIIHITESLLNYRFERPIKNGPPEITFNLPVSEIIAFQYKLVCSGVSTEVKPAPVTSLALEINFIANGQEQHITVYDTKAGGYKMIISPYRK
jgi:hypothetical protein